MNRRSIVVLSGSALAAALAGCAGKSDDSDGEPDGGESDGGADGSQPDQPEPVEFSGAGAGVRDGLDIRGGLTVVEAIHDGSSNFVVELVPSEGQGGEVLLNQTGAFEGPGAALVDGGTYQVDVDADGEWILTVRQPRSESGDATPVSLGGTGYAVEGPYEFSGTHTATATQQADDYFIVDAFPPTGDSGTTLFSEYGEFEGESTFDADGVGWIAVQAGGDWSIEIE